MNANFKGVIAECVEDVLDEMGLPWKRRDSGWVIPASAHRPREVLLSESPEQLNIEAELCSWDTLGELERQALTIVLDRASANMRYARCEMSATRAIVKATLLEQAIESELSRAIGGVLAGSWALAREATALLTPGLASEVLQFFHTDGERNRAVERI